MKSLLFLLLFAASLTSCHTTKTPQGQTVLLTAKNSRIVLGNPRRYKQKAGDTKKKIGHSEFANQ
jgi:hypothetical protein